MDKAAGARMQGNLKKAAGARMQRNLKKAAPAGAHMT